MSRKPFPLLVVFVLLSVVRASGQQLGSEVIERGPHHKVVRTTRLVTNELGEVSVRTGQYTALGDGMHYRAVEGDPNSPWIESEALVEPHPEGAISQRTPLKTLFQRNIATVGAVEVRAANQTLQFHLIGLRWMDAASGDFTWFATIRESLGEILAPNRVIWRQAFDGINADVVATVERGSVDVAVLLRENPPLPQGYSAENSRLQVISEFLAPPPPVIREAVMRREQDIERRAQMTEPDLINQDLDFGMARMLLGRAFLWSEADPRAERAVIRPVAKRWEPRPDGSALLIESVERTAIGAQLDGLPQMAGVVPKPEITPRFAAGLEPRTGPKKPMLLAAAGPTERALIIDTPIYVPSQSQYTFQSGQTYVIDSSVHIYSSTTFQPDAIIKISRGYRLQVSGSVFTPSSGYPVVFTARDDYEIGEQVDMI